MQLSEKQFNTKATTDSFDEIYTNYDLSVDETYSADTGYPFDYPTRWLNDPSMNKRIAIRRLNVTPSSHSFTLRIVAFEAGKPDSKLVDKIATIDVTEYDNLIKVLNFMCGSFRHSMTDGNHINIGLNYIYNTETNELRLFFTNNAGTSVDFQFFKPNVRNPRDDDVEDFMRFLNQENIREFNAKLQTKNQEKVFQNVWNRDLLHFHASFSTSRRKFIGKRGDFYQNLTLLYPPPTNESTFYIKFTSNGIKNILIRYCDFDVQLCFIVYYRKAAIL